MINNDQNNSIEISPKIISKNSKRNLNKSSKKINTNIDMKKRNNKLE